MILRVALLVAASLLCVLLWVARPHCEQEIGESVTSPDGRYVASIVVENCHATTPLVTLITIRRTNHDFSRSFYSHEITDPAVLILRGDDYNLGLEWIGQRLRVKCQSCRSPLVIEKQERFNGFGVDFDFN
jgi:hypothetical protein